MKGFELSVNGLSKKIAVWDGIVSILIFYSNDDCKLMISGIDHHSNKKIKWYNENLELGDQIHVKFTEIDSCSDPIRVSDAKTKNETKLERYNKLKESLIQKGML
ncbi:MAG: hypothetical protein LBR65_09320 [Culturomica sp.]|jgi:transcriptional accessory protein Tex/SPT6|nr:hypothetical protein [Culturomica sp.]